MFRTPILVLALLTIGLTSALTLRYKKVILATCNHKVETVKANTKFSFDMFTELNSGNTVYSPISVSGAMALAHEGADTNTFTELYHGLKWSTMPSSCIVKKGFKRIIDSLLTPSALYTVGYASAAFPALSHPLQPSYLTVSTNYYSSPAVNLDYASDPVGSEATINSFIALNTFPPITNMISGTGPGTALIIANAVTFQGKWVYEFNGVTQSESFNNADGTVGNTPMMRYSCGAKPLRHAYLPTFNAELLQLPYQGENHDMFVFLPNTVADFAALKSSLNYYSFSSAVSALTTKDVNVYLPKFNHEKDYELVPKFNNLGVHDAFNGAASDFSKLSTNPSNLYIDSVQHKATINVNEVGTKATAATVVTFCPARKRRGAAVTFRANRPFVYVIRQRESLTFEFMGSFESVPRKIIIKDVRKVEEKAYSFKG